MTRDTSVASRRVAIVHDPLFLEHRPRGSRPEDVAHPERPARLASIEAQLRREELFERWLAPRPKAAPGELLEQVHELGHLRELRRVADRGGGYLDPDTYAGPASLLAALHAAGAVMQGVDLVMDGSAERAFALTRPPGHHATRARAMGFCLINSVAVAAAHARRRGLERVMIVDWDVHHGNGTQDIFTRDPEVLYLSTHQWPLYPGSGALDEIGDDRGRGTTVNLPLPPGCDDAAYRRAFEEVVVPVARRFEPGLMLISAGYDAHAADPLASMRVSTTGFGEMAAAVATVADELCDGRVVACLEGGYDLEALAASVVATLRVFAGEADAPPADGAPRADAGSPRTDAGSPRADAAAELIAAARRIHGL